MSALQNGGENHEPINVLLALYDNLDALDFTGPLEVLTYAQHDPNKAGTCALDLILISCFLCSNLINRPWDRYKSI